METIENLLLFWHIVGDDFNESMKRNQILASSAIKRAMSDANAGDYESGIETLVGAISLIKQSPTAAEDRCQVRINRGRHH